MQHKNHETVLSVCFKVVNFVLLGSGRTGFVFSFFVTKLKYVKKAG